ncbi:MAG: hypothetical protein AAGK74_10020, partial [Chloroflexota bacterium]
MIHKTTIGLGLTVTVLTAGSMAGRVYWMLDVLTHFTIQFALLLTLCLVAGVVQRLHWRYLLVMTAGLIPNLVILYPYFLPVATAAAPTSDDLTIVSINVYAGNDDFDAVAGYVAEKDPDLVLFTEARYEFVDYLEQGGFA